MHFNDLYSGSSVAEKGTLYQLKERFDRRNVKKNVKEAVHACREFNSFVTYGYTVLAAMKILAIEEKDDKPVDAPNDNDEEKKKYLDVLAKKIVRTFVLPDEEIPEIQYNIEKAESTPDKKRKSTSFPCGFPGCKKIFKSDTEARRRHRANCAFSSPINECIDSEVALFMEGSSMEDCTEKDAPTEDGIFNYSRRVLSGGLFDIARKCASEEGDGEKNFLLWKHDFLSFASTGHTTYAGLSFLLIAQVEFLLSERKAAQLLHNRSVSLHGGAGRNVPMDFALELLNGDVKPDLRHRYGTLTQETIDRVGKSLKLLKEVEESIDIQAEKFSAIGRHRKQYFEKEIAEFVQDLKNENLLDEIPGRMHRSFPKLKAKRKVNWKKLEEWLKKKIDTLAKQQQLKLLSNN